MGRITACIGLVVVCLAVISLVQGKKSRELTGTATNLVIFAAFRETLITGSNTDPVFIPYDILEINEGGAYDTVTGTFTAPSNGYYHFSWFSRPAASCSNGAHFNTILFKNDLEQVAKTKSADGNSHSGSANVRLLAGEWVNMGIGTGSQCLESMSDGGNWLGFSGYLVYNII